MTLQRSWSCSVSSIYCSLLLSPATRLAFIPTAVTAAPIGPRLVVEIGLVMALGSGVVIGHRLRYSTLNIQDYKRCSPTTYRPDWYLARGIKQRLELRQRQQAPLLFVSILPPFEV